MGEVIARGNERIRLADHVDLSKAKSGCKHCNGRGIIGYKHPTPEQAAAGIRSKIPIICRCVSRNGGVKEDDFDRMLGRLQAKIADGTWALSMAHDIKALPADARERAISSLRRDAENPVKDENVRRQIKRALAIIDEPAKAVEA